MGIATGIASTITKAVRRAVRGLVGESTTLPPHLVTRYPELRQARWRCGGLPVRVGGWCLGVPTVSAITLWHTIWLAPETTPSAELLLHELRHVHQFEASVAFPMQYLWESVRRGYVGNRFEVDARRYAASRLRESHDSHS
jgi:hypothetical protein